MSLVLSQVVAAAQPGPLLRRRTGDARIDTTGEKLREKKIRRTCRSGRVPFDALARDGHEPIRWAEGNSSAEGDMSMRFLLMTKGDEGSAGGPPDENLMIEMGKFIEEMTQAGVLLATGGLDPNGIHIKSSGGEVTVTDGPFAEAKEAVVGFALIEVRSREEAVEVSKRFWKIVGDGEGEIRQVFGP
jgi:hypothetical protein